MGSVPMLKKHFQDLGFVEPVLVMKRELNPSLFYQKEMRFLLIPAAQAIILIGHIELFQTRSAILIGPSPAVSQTSVRTWLDKLHFALGVSWDEIVTQHQLIPGKLLQIWCSVNDGTDIIAFEFLQFDEPNVAPQNPLKRKRSLRFDLNTPSSAEIPEKFKNRIRKLGFSDPFMVLHQELNQSLFDEQQRYFMISNEKAGLSRFLLTISNQFLHEYQGFPHSVTLIGPSLSESKVYLEKSNVDITYKMNIGLKELVQDHKLIAGNKFQLWCFKNVNSEVGFALVDVDKSNVQVERLKKAPEIPEEIKNRIAGFRGLGIVFVIEKTLRKLDVQSSRFNRIRFSIPLDKLENQFLSDEEKRDFVKLYNDEGIDAFVIGPSIDHDDVKEFNIKLMKRGSYYFQGAGWMDFVKKYGLEEGKKVLIWSFRKPCANTDSQIGTGPSEIGFAMAVVNEKQV